jgi:hypothetical protein
MLHSSVSILSLRLQAVIWSMVAAILVFASAASAALLDFQPANGDYNVAANWFDYTNLNNAVPTATDEAIVRNGGTLNITAADGNATAAVIRIGAGPQAGDPVGPPTYGGNGTLNWTGGNILGGVDGPRINVGQRDNTNDINYTGIVNHSGGKISLNTNASFLVVGSSGQTSTPTSVYNLMPGGTIGLISGAGNTNNGINVRNGTFNMTGGQIVWDDASIGQRAMTLASTSGTLGSEVVASANFSGGTVEVNGGLRMNSSSHTKAYVTISGAADLWFKGSDVQLAANSTNTYAQVDMSAGMLRVGDVATAQERRLIVGDGGTGVFNLSGGTVNVNHSFVVANNSSAQGTFTQTGGTLTVRSVETNRNTPAGGTDLTVENARIIIDGPTAVFTQENTSPALTGSTTIGARGNGRFELRQGQANLRFVELSSHSAARATLNVMGGTLRIQDGLNRTDTSVATIPTINLTGGELELTPAGTSFAWQADLELQGTRFDPKPLGRLTTTVGVAGTKPGDFSLNSGSIWDLDIVNGTLGGADFVNVVNGSAALNGGLLNINLLGGYVPTIGDTVRIVSSNLPVTLDAGALERSDRHWRPIIAGGGNEIHLTFVPEPSSMLLAAFGLFVGASASRRSRTGSSQQATG